MKTIKDEVHLNDLDSISITELRRNPGQVLSLVDLGRTFLIERRGFPVAVISPLPGTELTKVIGPTGAVTYTLAK